MMNLVVHSLSEDELRSRRHRIDARFRQVRQAARARSHNWPAKFQADGRSFSGTLSAHPDGRFSFRGADDHGHRLDFTFAAADIRYQVYREIRMKPRMRCPAWQTASFRYGTEAGA